MRTARDYQAMWTLFGFADHNQESNVIRIFVNDVGRSTISGDQKYVFTDMIRDIGQYCLMVRPMGWLKYQWYSSVDNSNWGIINGAVNSSYDPQARFSTTVF